MTYRELEEVKQEFKYHNHLKGWLSTCLCATTLWGMAWVWSWKRALWMQIATGAGCIFSFLLWLLVGYGLWRSRQHLEQKLH